MHCHFPTLDYSQFSPLQSLVGCKMGIDAAYTARKFSVTDIKVFLYLSQNVIAKRIKKKSRKN